MKRAYINIKLWFRSSPELNIVLLLLTCICTNLRSIAHSKFSLCLGFETMSSFCVKPAWICTTSLTAQCVGNKEFGSPLVYAWIIKNKLDMKSIQLDISNLYRYCLSYSYKNKAMIAAFYFQFISAFVVVEWQNFIELNKAVETHFSWRNYSSHLILVFSKNSCDTVISKKIEHTGTRFSCRFCNDALVGNPNGFQIMSSLRHPPSYMQ